MELPEAIRTRRMVRAFADRPIDPAVVDELLSLSRYAPSAGRSGGVEFLVLSEASSLETFWDHASSEEWRRSSAQAPGLLAAPVIVLVVCDPITYAERYQADDKSSSPLGGLSASEWPVPFWFVDAGFHAMLLLLAALEFGLGSLFFHVRGARAELLSVLGCPEGHELVGAVALGYPLDATSARRPAQPLPRLIHRERWSQD